MPQIGEIKRGKEIERRDTAKYQWQPCNICGKPRWVRLEGNRLRSKICWACARKTSALIGDKSLLWKGGRVKSGYGYIQVSLLKDDFFYPMTGKKGRYVMEHRLVMAKHLGRCLQPWEKVHHKDGIKDHNEYSNLKMTTAGSHIIEHSKGYRDGYREGFQDGQSNSVKELKQEIRLLRLLLKREERQII